MDKFFLNEHRCKCGKLLLKGIFFDGALEIKCKRCGEINKIGLIKLIDDVTHYLLIINNRGIITNASDSACRILGYSRDELIGKFFTQINPTMPKEIGKRFFGPESALSEDNYYQLDTVHQSKDGKKIPIVVRLKLYRPTCNEKYVLLSAELKNGVNDNKKSGKDIPDFLDNACDFYFCIDKTGVGECVSPSVEKLFGFTPETIIGKNYFDFLPAEMKTKVEKTFKHFSAKETPFRVVHNKGKDLNYKSINVELYFTPNFNDTGKFIGYRVLGWLVKSPKVKKTITK